MKTLKDIAAAGEAGVKTRSASSITSVATSFRTSVPETKESALFELSQSFMGMKGMTGATFEVDGELNKMEKMGRRDLVVPKYFQITGFIILYSSSGETRLSKTKTQHKSSGTKKVVTFTTL